MQAPDNSGGMTKDGKYSTVEARKFYEKHWKTDLMSAPCEDPLFCFVALLCAPCASYQLRKRAIYNDMRNYVCCGGYMPCSGRCGEKSAPEACLACETCCCFGNSVLATRFMLQDELRLQNTQCDNCLMATTFALQQLACICDILAIFNRDFEDAANIIDLIADTIWCSVCSCMQTQHKVQLDERDQGASDAHTPIMQAPQAPSMTTNYVTGAPAAGIPVNQA